MLRLVAALALVGAVASGTASAQSPAPVPPPPDPRLLIIGDSVITGARAWIEALLGARGWRVNQTSFESMHTWQASAIVDSNRSHFGIGDVVVLQLGANDGSTPSELQAEMDELMQHLATVDRVYWVNLRQFQLWVPAANATIAAATARWPNLRIIDWDARSTPDPSLVYADGLHLRPSGQLALAQLISDTLDGFILETTATTTTLPSTTSSPVSAASTGVARPRLSDGVDGVTVLAAGVGGFVVIRLFAKRAKRKPDSSA